ncbi:MAG: 1-deoxy-D-xylulose-5-phosphate synthase, partial [Bacteroidaceae bacterium]|nr:1-deoxy-D-xylulose-5-phosphate synthase [Bacteroidaceae bacterium]
LITREQNIFEGLNIRYFGPADGHDVIRLVHTLTKIKSMSGPKMLHIHTIKGKGYEAAERDAAIWHAPGKFNPETGERLHQDSSESQPPKFQTVFGETLLELAQQNDKIVGITPAMPSGCSMDIMMQQIPERVFDVGIAEGHAVTLAAGMAKDGLLPYCNIYSSFAQRAYDNIIHDIAISGLHAVICLDRAGLVGEDGPTHHGAFDIPALRTVPGLTICSPMTEPELRNMMYTAQLDSAKGPWVIRYPRGKGSTVDWRTPMQEILVGSGRQLRKGTQICVLTLGPVGVTVERAINRLAGDMKSAVAHYDMRFVKPLDNNILNEVATADYNAVITVEDGSLQGGFGSAVTEWMQDHGYSIPIHRIGLPDHFIEHGPVGDLYRLVGMDEDSIMQSIISTLNDTNRP